MTFTPQEVADLQKVADENEGHCDRCKRIIKIYSYKLNRTIAKMLKAMADRVAETGQNVVNFDDVPGAYSQKTQRTKMRLHGLIARVKQEGVQVANTWLITGKGWDFLKGKPVSARVIVFNNQVLGHDGGLITYAEALGSPTLAEDIKQTPITTKEAEAYSDVREPKHYLEYDAEYLGPVLEKLKTKETYHIVINRLQFSHPVILLEPVAREYKDIAAFQRDWKIT